MTAPSVRLCFTQEVPPWKLSKTNSTANPGPRPRQARVRPPPARRFHHPGFLFQSHMSTQANLQHRSCCSSALSDLAAQFISQPKRKIGSVAVTAFSWLPVDRAVNQIVLGSTPIIKSTKVLVVTLIAYRWR